MTSIIVGLAFIGVGIFGLIQWFPDFILFMKGMGPVSLLLGGLVALVAGISSFESTRGEKKS